MWVVYNCDMFDVIELKLYFECDDFYMKCEMYWCECIEFLLCEVVEIEFGGGEQCFECQCVKGKMMVCECVVKFCDLGFVFFEVGFWFVWGQYEEWGGVFVGGVVIGVGQICDCQVMVVVNDVMVKVGVWFFVICKKVLWVQEIVFEN